MNRSRLMPQAVADVIANWLSNGTRNWSNVNDPKLDAMILKQRGVWTGLHGLAR